MNKKILFFCIALLASVMIVIGAVFIDNEQSEFDLGTYTNTIFNIDHIEINDKNNPGEFTSQVFDSSATTQWNNIQCVRSSFGELPDYQVIEEDYGKGNLDMTGNVLLMHFNNDPSAGENKTYVFDYSGTGNDGLVYGNASLASESSIFNFYSQTDNGIILSETQHTGSSAPHTADIVKPNPAGKWNNYTYWIYVGEQTNGNIDLWFAENLTDPSNWTSYASNPIISGNQARWPTVIYENNQFWMAHTVEYASGAYLVLRNSSDGINFFFYDNITTDFTSTSTRGTFNPNFYKNINGSLHILYQYDNGTIEELRIRSADTIQDLPNVDYKVIGRTVDGIWSKAPNMFYRDGYYWLLTEGNPGNWNTYAYYSSDIFGPFTETSNSPIWTAQTACPMSYIENNILYTYVCNIVSSLWKLSLHTSDFTTSNGASSPKFTENFYFDGNDDYIEVQDDNSLKIDKDLTITGWISSLDVNSENTIVDKFYDGTDRSYLLRVIGNRIQLELGSADGSTSTRLTGNSTLQTEEWYFIAGSFNGSQMKVYLNGVLDNETDLKSDNICFNNQPLRIGMDYNVNDYTNAYIDDVAVWNRTLADSEILDIYERGISKLNLSIRSCNDASCIGESWIDIDENISQNLSITDNRYFQYKLSLDTDDSAYSPELYNVTVDYTPLNVLIVNTYFPPNNSINRSLNPDIYATFNMDINESTINNNTVFITDQNYNIISTETTYSSADRKITISPSRFLNENSTYTVNLNQGLKSINSIDLGTNFFWDFTTELKDTDQDGIPDVDDNDDDNDGIQDEEDFLKGNSSNILTGDIGLEIQVNRSSNLSKKYNKTEIVEFFLNNTLIFNFSYSFGKNNILDLTNITIRKNKYQNKGSLLVSGLKYIERLKDFYLDNLSSYHGICIKDADIDSIDDISESCKGPFEQFLNCPGFFGRYNCSYISNNLIKISGLNHSGVIQSDDISPPRITLMSISYSGSESVDVTLTVITDEDADCKYDTGDTSYGSMSYSLGGSRQHSDTKSYSQDTSGNYYVLCRDDKGNIMSSSNSISFDVNVNEGSNGDGTNTGSSGGGGGGGVISCDENWVCGSWNSCSDGFQSRECSDLNTCGTSNQKPIEFQTCSQGCEEIWQCSPWSVCENKLMTRECFDLNDCDTEQFKPSEIESCEYIEECYNGIQDNEEEGIDCGGLCPECETCFDRIQNQDEEGIDCGGTCRPCRSGDITTTGEIIRVLPKYSPDTKSVILILMVLVPLLIAIKEHKRISNYITTRKKRKKNSKR